MCSLEGAPRGRSPGPDRSPGGAPCPAICRQFATAGDRCLAYRGRRELARLRADRGPGAVRWTSEPSDAKLAELIAAAPGLKAYQHFLRRTRQDCARTLSPEAQRAADEFAFASDPSIYFRTVESIRCPPVRTARGDLDPMRDEATLEADPYPELVSGWYQQIAQAAAAVEGAVELAIHRAVESGA